MKKILFGFFLVIGLNAHSQEYLPEWQKGCLDIDHFSKGLPHPDASRKLLGDELFSKMKPYGHVVVRVYEGGTSYQVFVLDNKSTDYHITYKTEVIVLH